MAYARWDRARVDVSAPMANSGFEREASFKLNHTDSKYKAGARYRCVSHSSAHTPVLSGTL